MKVKEIIVVEGKSDTLAINRAVDADTIETNGSAVGKETLQAIQHAQQVRGVIIFTDPDVPGEKIRKTISHHVPGCRHAFLTKRQAYGGRGQSLGIEHASPEAIREALSAVYTEIDTPPERISQKRLTEAGLTFGPNAKWRRTKLGEALNIGYTNGKQLYKRLRMFQVTPEAFEKALDDVLREEQYGQHFDA
ncbi:ribonuclease M5 [Camelliibacillus cellulosilyticus]|uniref:Ribonuclease M5 n=1 Tax=Camelliibacillus cellulosilyticus TaxID=2174486 RepID=A0ABV9GQ45_9BACL